MKKITFIVGLCLGTQLMAQTISPDKQWTMRFRPSISPEYGDVYNCIDYSLRSDTVIDGEKYWRCYERNYWDGEKAPEQWKATSCYFRQEGEKVLLKVGNMAPLAVIDYSLQAGDTFCLNLDYYDGCRKYVVTAVSDTVFEYSADKSVRRVLYLKDGNQSGMTDIWIEGIGSICYGIEGLWRAEMAGSAPSLEECKSSTEGMLFQRSAFLPNSYDPFVKPNKRWHIFGFSYSGQTKAIDYYFTSETETCANGKTYRKMYQQTDEGTSLVGLFREANGRVFQYDESLKAEKLFYDFCLMKGETLISWYSSSDYTVAAVDEQLVNGHPLKALTLGTYLKAESLEGKDRKADCSAHYTWTETWLAGIGNPTGPINPLNNSGYGSWCTQTVYVMSDVFLPLPFADPQSGLRGQQLVLGDEREGEKEDLHYEFVGDSLHVYGTMWTNCGPDQYIYCIEKKDGDLMKRNISFQIDVMPETEMDCAALHEVDLYFPFFDFNEYIDYSVTDSNGTHKIGKTIKTVSLSFDKDMFELQPSYYSNDRFLLYPTSDPDILTYSWGDVNYTNKGGWSPYDPFDAWDWHQPSLLWRTIYLPLDENEGFASYTVDAKEELIYEDVLLDYVPLEIPVGSSQGKARHADVEDDVPEYSKSQYPDSNIADMQLIGYGVYGGQKVKGRTLSFQVCPFRYDAEKRNLYLLTDMKVNIAMKFDSTPTPPIHIPHDYDGDGVVTVNDITTIIRMYLDGEGDFISITNTIDAYLDATP